MRKLKNEELDRLSLVAFKSSKKTPITIILDNVRSLNNIGSIFRTADAFLVEKIFLCGITACPPHKDINKTALGSTESMDWEYRENTKDLVQELRGIGCSVWAVEQVDNAIMLDQFEVMDQINYVLVFGNEVKGVSQEVVNCCEGAIEIPQYGTKHSLNISVSGGIVLWDIWAKLTAKKNPDGTPG